MMSSAAIANLAAGSQDLVAARSSRRLDRLRIVQTRSASKAYRVCSILGMMEESR